ncbi:GNAT family N-acetyltransferase [Nonomuraea sp. NPDC049695]|uniref:GNAT family N-acetyltransferase n=1 Tax=Nonomuraea sp. NPDC049695 TaxID=3154734 RepID=UPI0034392A6D
MIQMPTLSATEIATDRLLLRKAQGADREGLIELATDPEIRTYLGGPRPRGDVERYIDAVGAAGLTSAPGSFVIADAVTDELIGTLALARRSAERPGHVTEDGEELELSYVLRRSAWGVGLAFEAATAVLRAAAGELPDQPVVVVTQTANRRSLKLAARLGFRQVGTFEQFGAEQTLSTADLHSFAV